MTKHQKIIKTTTTRNIKQLINSIRKIFRELLIVIMHVL